jgi:hypothetical protein
MPINLDGVQEKAGNEFEPIPDGLYYMRVTAGVEKDASGDKNAQHEFELTIQHGEFENRKFKHWFALSEKMVPYLKHFYSVLGAKNFGNLTPSDFQGKPFMAEVYIDEYNGKKNNKLQLGMYYEWDGKAESANGVKPEKKETTAAPAAKAAPAAAAAASSKPAPKKTGPFSNAPETDEPPF